MAFQPSRAGILAFALQATLRTVLAVPARSVHHVARPVAAKVGKTSTGIAISSVRPVRDSFSSATRYQTAARRLKHINTHRTAAILRRLESFDPSNVPVEDNSRAMLALQTVIEHYTPKDYSLLTIKYHRTLRLTWAAFFRLAERANFKPTMFSRQFDSIIYSLMRYPPEDGEGEDKWATMAIPDVLEAMSWFGLVPTGKQLTAIANLSTQELPMVYASASLARRALGLWRQRRTVIDSAQALGIDFFNGHGALFNQTLMEADFLSRGVYDAGLEEELKREAQNWIEQRQQMVDQRLEVINQELETLRRIQAGEGGSLRADDVYTTSPAALFLVRDALIPGSNHDPFDILRLMIGLTTEDPPNVPHRDPKAVASAIIRMAGAYRRARDVDKLTRLARLLTRQKFTAVRAFPLPPLPGEVYSSLLSSSTTLRSFRRILSILEGAPRPSHPPRFSSSWVKLLRRRAQKMDTLSPNQWQKRLDCVFERWGVGLPLPIFKRAAGPHDPILRHYVQARRTPKLEEEV